VSFPSERNFSTHFRQNWRKTYGFIRLLRCSSVIIKFKSRVLQTVWKLVWPARRLATRFSGGNTVVMVRPFDEIVRLDRRWFRAHPERRHRCRWPDPGERAICDSNRGARLVIAIRHLGRGHMVYQPVIFQGLLPKDERSAGILFALAATSPEPIPFISEMTPATATGRLGSSKHQRAACAAARGTGEVKALRGSLEEWRGRAPARTHGQ
jgi:hypothetical protein